MANRWREGGPGESLSKSAAIITVHTRAENEGACYRKRLNLHAREVSSAAAVNP